MTDWADPLLRARKALANVEAAATLEKWELAYSECERLRMLATEILLAVKRRDIERNTLGKFAATPYRAPE